MKEVVLKVEGMTCQGCVHTVTKVLERKGAQEIEISLEKGMARCKVDPSVSAQELAEAVTKFGYTATVLEG